jgi:hypothetical protein
MELAEGVEPPDLLITIVNIPKINNLALRTNHGKVLGRLNPNREPWIERLPYVAETRKDLENYVLSKMRIGKL